MKNIKYLFLSGIILTFSFCAKKGRPGGGPKDEDAPIFIIADPPYESINFDKDEIKMEFDEFIVLKDLTKQLVVSPPLKNPSIITPQGTPSKYLTIKILDTLLKNTTYTFDFGNSVQDNNEGNPIERFKYVFSTGSYVDSLNLSGSVKNAFSSEKIKNIKLLLYRYDTAYTDSTIYKSKPNYVTSTLDTTIYDFSNLKEGKYLLVALNDVSSDYIFNPRTDKIGYVKDTVILPRDSILREPISLYQENLPFDFKRAKETRKGQIVFGYEGEAPDLKVNVLSEVPDDFKTISLFEKGKDTLNLWHSPIEKDSLIFTVAKGDFIDTLTVNLRKKKLDSLTISSSIRGILNHNDTLFIKTNNPLISMDTTLISLVDKDTLKVPFVPYISKTESQVVIPFEKDFKQNYTLSILPNAFKDIFNQANDSLVVKFNTKDIEDYGDITLNVQNPNSLSTIIELTDNKDVLVSRQFVESSKTISFKYLNPKEYKIRVIYDTNKNGKWDPGNFLEKTLPEKVEYVELNQPVRSNWSLNEVITINE